MDGRRIFERSLFELDDQRLFDIARNYLGEVKTPFHKPEIISRLTSYISSPDVQNRMRDLIDEEDARILNVVRLTRRPTMNDLVHILGSTSLNYFSLRQKVINLQERLLILIFSDHTIKINPIVYENVLERLFTYPLPFAAQPYDQINDIPPLPALVPAWFAGLFSFIESTAVRPTSDRMLRKSDADKLCALHAGHEDLSEFFALVFKSLLGLGIIRQKKHQYSVCMKEASNFLSTTSWQQAIVRIAASLSESPDRGSEFLMDLLSVLSHMQADSEEDFCILWTMLSTFHDRKLISSGKEGLSTLLDLGMLQRDGRHILLTGYVKSLFSGQSPNMSTPAVIDSDFTLTCGPYLSSGFTSTVLALGLEIRKIDTRYLFSITKQSAKRAFDHHIGCQRFIEALDELTEHHIPANITTTIEHWHQEYTSLSVYTGTIIEASPARSRVIEKHPRLSEHIIRQFSPTLFLMRSDTKSIWKEVLSTSGFEMMSEPAGVLEPQKDDDGQPRVSPTAAASLFIQKSADGEHKNNTGISEQLAGKLKELSLSDADRQDLIARIEKKLIISENQLSFGRMDSFSVMEAKGLDYQGKLQLAKQALNADDDLLELHMSSSEGGEQILLVRPTAIVKESTGHLLEGRLIPSDQAFVKPLRKIFLLRKLRGSLYTPT